MPNAIMAPTLIHEIEVRADEILAVGEKVFHVRAVKYARISASDNIRMCDGTF
jgi:hypothetical protein